MKKMMVVLGLVVSPFTAHALVVQSPVARTAHEVRVESVTLVPAHNPAIGGGNPELGTYFEVVATATFSNGCMAPEEFAKELQQNAGTQSYRLLGISSDRFCTMDFRPVTRRVVIDRIYGDIVPAVTVNGVRALLLRE